jgi:hypothetical protein
MWRVYIKDDQGTLIRLPKKIFSSDGFKFSQFAGTIQKAITVEWEGHLISRISASYIEFDAEGVRDVRASAAAAAYWYEAAELESRVRRMKVADLSTARKARNLRKQVTWQLSDEDFALIVGDTIKSPRRPIPILHVLGR